MKTARDLTPMDQPLTEKVKRAVRPPRKNAPATEQLRGWAKSGIKGRNKS